MSLAKLLRFPKQKSALDQNTDELERITVEFITANRAVNEARLKLRHVSDALQECQAERARILREKR